MILTKILKKIILIKKGSQNTDTQNMSAEIRIHVQLRDKLHQEKAKRRLERLLIRVQQENGSNAADYIARIFFKDQSGERDRAYAASSSQVDTTIYSHLKPRMPHENKALYQKILPLCQLAYLEERKGIAKEHAWKLSCIFDNEKAVYQYLINFPKGNKVKHLVYDACRFDIPPMEQSHFAMWKKMAQMKANMLNPRFRTLLAHAVAIKRISSLGSPARIEMQHIKDKEKELAKVSRMYRSLVQTPVQNPTLADKVTRTGRVNSLRQEQSRLYLQLAALARGISLDQASLLVLQAFYEEHELQNQLAQQFMIDHGINVKSIALFNSLDRNNDDKAIPAITLKGSDVGYPGKYLTKLNTSNVREAALAVCLGKMTYCCQSLDSKAIDCVIHGIKSPNGAFYVLFEGDENHPNLNDPVLAQAWVWRSTQGDLCLDSIEAIPRVSSSLVATMYRYLGLLLCEDKGINRVNTGESSGITDRVSLSTYPAVTLKPVDYQGYRSSERQRFLYEKSMPYLYYNQSETVKFQHIVEHRIRALFSHQFSLTEPLMNNELLKKTIAFFIYSGQDKPWHFPFDLLQDLAGKRSGEFEQLLAVNRAYYNFLNENPLAVSLNEVLEWDKKGAYIGSLNENGLSPLHLVKMMRELKQVIYNFLNENQQSAPYSFARPRDASLFLTEENYSFFKKLIQFVLENQPWDESEALIRMVSGILSVDENITKRHLAIFNLFSKRSTFHLVRPMLGSGVTPLHLVAPKPYLLSAFLKRIPKSQRLEAISFRNHYGFSVLHLAIAYPESLKVILKSLAANQILDVIRMSDFSGRMTLHLATAHRESLRILLESIQHNETLDAIRLPDRHGNTLLHDAAAYPDTLNDLLELYPQAQKRNAVRYANHEGNTVLHQATVHSESLRILLNLYPEQERLEALSVKNSSGASVLNLAGKKRGLIRTIIELLPEDQRLDAIILAGISNNIQASETPFCLESPERTTGSEDERQYDDEDENSTFDSVKEEETLLHQCTTPDALSAFLNGLTETQKIDAICQFDESGYTILHRFAMKPDLLRILLAVLPESQRLKAVNTVNHYGTTVLHLATEDRESLNMVLELYSEDQKRDAVLKVNEYGRSVLDYSVQTYESLRIILELFPQAQRLEIARQVDPHGQTLLHQVATHSKSLRYVLDLYPQEQRVEAVCQVNDWGKRVLDYAASSRKSLRIVLELFPQEQRVEVVCQENSDGHSLLDDLLYNAKSMAAIFDLLSEAQWLDAIFQKDNGGSMLSKLTLRNPKLLRALWEKIPEDQRFGIMRTSSPFGCSLCMKQLQTLNWRLSCSN
ncbi:ankyrin repeat domain-containing protein [Legionella sp. km535]|uniref:ankyrin repeat domain-containing protein n=1 Tax=Legionella sp. km535 TaxID=2498107 RepID=UPI000F8E7B11|nr:ankyrin repeat domain-containing protein [Legionella sp. km535]RUR18020.1 ankyrin repeat domain-containing protein [Legionella sp. km535]